MKRQKGFLIVTAIVLIVVLAMLAAGLVSIFIRTVEASLRLKAIPAASALAESGLEQAQKNFTLTDFTARQTCTTLGSTVSLSTGDSITALATNTANNPRYAYTALTTSISNSTNPTTITVTDSSVFAPDGWVLIGREVFRYKYIANSTTLGGVARAQDSSLATDHPSGSIVSQYQCYIAGIGHAPAVNPLSIREYQQGMRQPLLFAVGQSGTLLRWNGPTSELAWDAVTSGSSQDLKGISALNYHSAWAVGNNVNAGYELVRLQGSTWTRVNLALGSETNLLAVDATSSKEAWAVGERTAGNVIALLRWVRNASNDSTNWCRVPCSGISLVESGVQPSRKSILAIKTLDLTGDGYADVGYAAGGSPDEGNKEGVIWYYTANNWGPINKAPLNFTHMPSNAGQLRGVDMVRNGSSAPQEVFFAGQNNSTGGLIIRLRATGGTEAWSTISTAAELHAISVVDTDGDGYADFGCAVGDNGTVVSFNNTMASTTTTLATGGNALKSVFVISPTDIWVVGTGGVRFHYDGTSWTSLTNNITTTNNLYSIVAVFPKQITLSAWHELIN